MKKMLSLLLTLSAVFTAQTLQSGYGKKAPAVRDAYVTQKPATKTTTQTTPAMKDSDKDYQITMPDDTMIDEAIDNEMKTTNDAIIQDGQDYIATTQIQTEETQPQGFIARVLQGLKNMFNKLGSMLYHK